ncbi:hypothetical protein [Nocardioides sp. SLBN-35]|uniref:hypothetical protein n=1 Tax=Nocardioides sp. SLBN-35 TaxID=2768445 RepID=UPI001153B324|nr:hypothetical protein [Nocardioides sp. SLBN-35]TQK71394.1 hypothetical protein FBY23_3187 [Nocardioides sp. SLBN-35]
MSSHRHRGPGRVATSARRSVRPGLAALLVLAVGSSLGGVAAAYFGSDGAGTGSLTTGDLHAPTGVTATTQPGTGDVDIAWTAPAGGVAPAGYRVQRVPASGPAVDACGTTATSTTAGTGCTDEEVPLGTSTYVVTAVLRTWTAASAPSDAVSVDQVTQAITFTSEPTDPVYAGPAYAVSAEGGDSGNPVLFSSATPAVCTSSGTYGATITFVGAGTCTITADQAGTAYYAAAPQVEQTFQVARASQVITFTSTAPGGATVGDSGYQPTATGGASGNPVVLSIDASTSANCSIAAGVVSYLRAGTCTIDANQAGDADHAAAPQVQQSFAVSPAAQAITFTSTPPTDAKVGDTYAVTATGGASGNAVVLATTTPAACSVAGTGPGAATVTFTAQGTCTITADQAGDADHLAAAQVTQSIGVTRRAQTITGLTSPSSPAVGGSYTVTATGGGSGNPVVFSTTDPARCTATGANGHTITFVSAGSCTVEANQAGNATWAPATTASVTFTISAPADTTAPTITSIDPGNESGVWTSIACQPSSPNARICVTATDGVGVDGVSIKLTKSNGRCWSGSGSSSFDAANCGTPIALTLSAGVWRSSVLAVQGNGGQPNFNTTSYTLEVTVRDAAGNTTTATRTFTVTG